MDITIEEKVKQKEAIKSHIEKAFSNVNGNGKRIVASYGQEPKTGKDLAPKVFHCSSTQQACDAINTLISEENRNVYMPLCLMQEDLSQGHKGGEKDIISTLGFCCDFDLPTAVEDIEKLPVEPTITLETSPGRYQALYILRQPIEDKIEAKELAKRLKAFPGCDHGTMDLSHVWRIPGTLNWPNKKKFDAGRSLKPFLVEEISRGDYVSEETLLKHFPKVVIKQTKQSQADGLRVWNGDIRTLPVKTGTKDLILNGSPVGQRSEPIMTVLNALVFANLKDTEIISIFERYAIGEKFREKGSKLKWLQPQIDKARSHVNVIVTDRAPNAVFKSTEPAQEYWEKPVSLKKPAMVNFTSELFPGVLGRIINAVATATETPLELAAGLLLPVIGTACQSKFVVQVKPGYTEPLNIWTLIALDPANRKSTVLIRMSKPLSDWEKQRYKELEPSIRQAKSTRENQIARLKSLRGKYGKARSDELEDIESDILEIEKTIEKIPSYPQVWSQDVTPERLGSLMSEHDNKMSILSAEGGVFDIIGGRYSNGIPNLDLYLQSHSCDPVKVDRGSRDPIYLDQPALTLGLSPQPEVMKSLADRPGFRGRGLLARFLYLLPQSNLGYRGLRNDPVPAAIEQEYCDLVFSLLDIEPAENKQGEKIPYILKFSNKAYQEWLDFALVVEKNLREGGKFGHITDWAGKLPGAAARIAGLLHCAENPSQPWVKTISFEIMQKALEIASIFSSHALIAFDIMGTDKVFDHARKLWRWIERNGQESFSKRDCFNALKGTFHRVKKMEDPLRVLVERNHIREIPREKKIGKPSTKYIINPELLKEWK